MIDFESGALWKLRKCDESAIGKNLRLLLIEGEQIIGAYKSVRDFVVFTDRRVIACNVQGITGKKQDYTSMPYKKISVFSIETSGPFYLDCEHEMYFSGAGKVKFEFLGDNEILQIGQCISKYAL